MNESLHDHRHTLIINIYMFLKKDLLSLMVTNICIHDEFCSTSEWRIRNKVFKYHRYKHIQHRQNLNWITTITTCVNATASIAKFYVDL